MFSILKGSARGLAAEGGGDKGSLDSSGERGEGRGGLRASCVGEGGLRASCEGGVGGRAGLEGAAVAGAGAGAACC